MTEVFLHVYDVANSDNIKTNNAIMQINKIFKDGIGLGGIFHSAVEVYDNEEWSFGFCEVGTGVFSCPRKENPMYVYRESLSLGYTQHSKAAVKRILIVLAQEWQGCSYDLLARNCNHFCNDFCTKLGVEKLPGWVNRFANAGETAVEVAETTSKWLRTAKTEVVSASKVAYRSVFGDASTSAVNRVSSFFESSGSDRNRGNILSLPFLKTPVNLFSRIGSASSPAEAANQNLQFANQKSQTENNTTGGKDTDSLL